MSSNLRFMLSATNFSSHAVEAATVAAKLALRRSEMLQLVHVCEFTGAKALDEAKRRLESEARRLRQVGAQVEPVLLPGDHPAKVFVDYIRAEGPGLVVVSSAAKGPIDRWALGSFSEAVAEMSPVPTLVVRNPGAFESWDWVRDRLQVLLALDLYATSDVVLRWAKAFRMTGPCDLIACHINRRRPTPLEAAVAPGQPVNPPALQSKLVRELRKKVRDQIGDDACSVVVKPYFGDPGPGIVEIAREVKAQLIAVGTHQRQGLRRLAHFSVSREILHQGGMNVVCVPVTAKFDPREAHIPEYRRVLVATDFSDLGNAAIPFACGACSIGGLVRIVHVARSGRRAPGRPATGRSADLRQQLRSLVPDETGARCQPPEVEVLESRDPAEAICAEAERFGADLVCMASHGLGASRALHGSVTKDVLKKVRRPLLVIRRPDE